MTVKAKHLRPELKRALNEGLNARGLSRRRGHGVGYFGDRTWVEEPIVFGLDLGLDSDRYGGLRFGGGVDVLDQDLDSFLASVSADALSASGAGARTHALPIARLTTVSTARIRDPERGNARDWFVRDESEIAPACAEYFEFIDGLLRPWACERRSVDCYLDGVLGPLAGDVEHNLAIRPNVLLAMTRGRVDLARALVAGYRPAGGGDTTERFALFERELANMFPDYGPLQLS